MFYRGSGAIVAADYKQVKFVGQSKAGNPVTIKLKKAINMGNVDWKFADKDEVIPEITFTAVYDNTDATASTTEEPWEIETTESVAGAGEILLGNGVFYIGETAVALCRGGGQFTVERKFRELAADGDRGAVEGRVVLDEARPVLKMNVLSMLTRIADMYPAITSSTVSSL